jgi:hypothetical protein
MFYGEWDAYQIGEGKAITVLIENKAASKSRSKQ